MDSDDETIELYLMYRITKRNPRKQRRWSVHPIHQKRKKQGEYHNLVKELAYFGEKIRDYFRLSVDQFEEVERHIGPILQNRVIRYRRDAISPRARLAISLRYVSIK